MAWLQHKWVAKRNQNSESLSCLLVMLMEVKNYPSSSSASQGAHDASKQDCHSREDFIIIVTRRLGWHRSASRSKWPFYWSCYSLLMSSRWIRELDVKMCLSNQHICLLIDNFSGHFIDFEPHDIRLEYFRPNLTSHVQPLDAGIIHCFKGYYFVVMRSSSMKPMCMIFMKSTYWKPWYWLKKRGTWSMKRL